jgi:hypothetical protein
LLELLARAGDHLKQNQTGTTGIAALLIRNGLHLRPQRSGFVQARHNRFGK